MPECKQGEIAAELEMRISEGVYKDKLPSASELAAEFNVNIRTMAKSLSLLGRKRLILKRQGIGAFVVDSKKPGLRILGIYCGQGSIQESSYHLRILKGIQAVLDEAKCHCDVETNFKGDFANYDGVIFIGHSERNPYKALKKMKKPFVVIEKMPQPEICSVEAAMREAVESALTRALKSGFKRIAYIGMTFSRELNTDAAKFQAWMEATDDALHGIDFSLVRHVWPLPENGYPAAKDILEKAKPDAIFVTSDLMAPGVYRAIAESGLRIPEDVAVLGCDALNIPLNPTLASIATPRYEMGSKSAETLLDLIREPGRRRTPKLSVPAELRPGDSLPLKGHSKKRS